MKQKALRALLLPASLLFLSLGASPAFSAAAPAEHEVFVNTDYMKWDAAPPSLPAGAKLTVLHGDPHKPGPFVMRLSTPGRYTIPPHWHTNAESLTVVSGTLNIGMGDTFDRSKGHQLRAGGYHFLPAKAHHFAFTDQPTVVQIHGEGPFDINYINPADDPRKGGKK